jgi:hypothetical protein
MATPRNLSNCVACVNTTRKQKQQTQQQSELLTKTQTFPAPWLAELGRQAIPRHSLRFQTMEASGFAPTFPQHSDTVVRYKHPNVPQKVVYWAAGPSDVADAQMRQSAECAYGKYENMGVAVRHNNTLTFVLQSPRPYQATQRGKRRPQLWCRHLHFVEVGAKTNAVPDTSRNVLFTLGVFPCDLLAEYKSVYSCTPLLPIDTLQRFGLHSMFVGYANYLRGKRNGALGVCAVDHPEYPPISSNDAVIDWKSPARTIAAQLEANSVVHSQGMNCPLVVYCVDDQCAAAQALIVKLCALGYCNVYYMKHGMDDAAK